MRIGTVRKILLGLTAFSLFVTPAQASEITDRNGASLIDPTANVHNLYAQQIDGTTARSSYDKFSLDQNQIANMHFNQRGGTTFATDLINTVNQRIDINGTVNAIRNGAIDGNLYFLSPEGIAVGKTGVINAGAFIAQSEGGSVDINGIVNARNNITLQAQNITLNGAQLTSNTDIDFTTLVNAGTTVNTLENLSMTADPTGSGDIIIEAKATRNFTATPVLNGSVSLMAIAVNAGISDLDSAYAQNLLSQAKNYSSTKPLEVSANIADSIITADGALTINTVEHIDANLVNGTHNTVGATVIAINHNAKTLIAGSTLSGSSVDIAARQAGNINSTVNQSGADVAEFGSSFNSVKRTGDTAVSLRGSSVTATNGNLNIRAEDNLAVTLNNPNDFFATLGIPSTVVKSINDSSTRVIINRSSDSANKLSATGDINVDAVNDTAADLTVANAFITTINAIDNAAANITIRDNGHSFKGNNINFSTRYNPTIAAASSPSTANLGGDSAIEVSNGNYFNAHVVNFAATSGATAQAPDIITDTTTNVKVGNQFYGAGANINVDSSNNIGRHVLNSVRATVNAFDSVTAYITNENDASPIENLTVNATCNGNSILNATMSMTNNSNVTVKASVGGKWNVVDNITVNAASNDDVGACVRQNYYDTYVAVNNFIGGNTIAAIDKGASINANNVSVSARSNFNAGGGDDIYTLVNYFDSRADNYMTSALTVDKKTAVDVNANVNVTAKGAQSFTAVSDGNILNKVNAIGTVTSGNKYADAKTKVAVDNQVRIAKNASLNANDEFTARANDFLTINSSSIGNNSGFAGALINRTTNDINRKNLVDVNGNVSAGGVINVEAGGAKDSSQQIVVNANTDSSNNSWRTFRLPVNLQTSSYNLTENNSVTVEGNIIGAGDVNIRATEGKINVRHSNRMRGSLNDAYQTNQLEIGNGDRINRITVNGLVKAGTNDDDINITLSSTVVPADYYITGTDNSGSLTVTSNVDFDYSEGDMDYASELRNRKTALEELISQYTAGDQTTVYTAALSGYVAELERVTQKLRNLGLITSEGNRDSVIDDAVFDIGSNYVRDDDGKIIGKNEASVSGKNVLIEANGTLNQGYVNGMINIGKSLEALFVKQTEGTPAQARKYLDVTADSDEYVMTVASNVDGGTNDGRISGSNIYIAALDINVNGIIQAGYDSYIIDVKPDDIVDGQYVGKSGAVYNPAKGCYDYYVPVSYVNGRLRAEDIETGGGTVYLSGRIASTGKGKIFAANGLANINIRNNSSLPIELGNLINNQRAGKITIADTGNDTWNEFTPGQTRTIINYAQQLKEHFGDGMLYDTVMTAPNSLDRQNIQYLPAKGLRYIWTSGNEERTTTFYSWSGERCNQTITVAEIEKGASLSLHNPAVNRIDNTLYLTAKSQLVSASSDTNSDFHTEYTTLQTYTFNIDASKPITLGFIGQTKGPIDINSDGSVYLNGNVHSDDQSAVLSVTSNGGSIVQSDDAFLRADNLCLRAHDDITGINIESIGSIIDVSARGNVSLTATGDINGLHTPNVVAKNIKLTSSNGAVGKYGNPLMLDASGAVDVSAQNDIAISTPLNKTLTIGQISSNSGDVFLNTCGDNATIVQSATYQPDIDDVDVDELTRSWIDAGLIAPTDDYEGTFVGALRKAVEEYVASVSGEYQTYVQIRDDFEKLKSTAAAEYAEYLSIKDGYDANVERIYETEFQYYLQQAQVILADIENKYSKLEDYETKQAANILKNWEKQPFDELKRELAGYDSPEAYYIAHAATLLDNPDYHKFIGYTDLEVYMATTHDGILVNKYGAFNSVDEYLQSTTAYALEQKYGAYPSIDDFLYSDEQYRLLVAARDNVSFPSTLQAMLEQTELERQAASYNIASNHLYIDNKKIR